MQTRSRSKSPDSRPSATAPAAKAKTAKATPAPVAKDATDELPPQSLTTPSASTAAGLPLTDSLADQQMETLAAKIEAGLQKQKDLLAELERDKSALQLLLAHPRGELPEAVPSSAVVTAAAASALQAADEEKRRRDEADAIRLQSDTAAADRARLDRFRKLQQLALPAVDAPVLPAPRRRALSGSPERQLSRPVKVTRFATPETHDSDTEDEELSIVPAVLSRPKYLTNASKLLLYLVNSTCSPCPPVIPTLHAAHTLVYAAALAHVSNQLRFNFGAEQPSFHHILLILKELPQFFTALFENKPDKEAMATTALTKWHRHFNDQLTRLLRLADNHRQYVDAQFTAFIASLDDAVPATFDPVALLQMHVKDLAKSLTAHKSKQIMRAMFAAPVQSAPQHQSSSSGGRNAGGNGSGKGGGGRGKGGKGPQHHSWPPPPGLPGQDWNDHHWMYVRFPKDANGKSLRNCCFKCGAGSAPGSSNHHFARDCRATDAQVLDWVRNMKPVQ